MKNRELSDKTLEKYKLVIDEWFVNGFNGTKAYQQFYKHAKNSTADSNFRKILGNTRIQEYIEDKRNKLIEELEITLKRQLYELEDLKERSKVTRKYSTAIDAIKEQNKLLGYYEKDNSQKSIVVGSDITPEEREARIKFLLKKREQGLKRK
ncbi:terminase small subunit [Mesoflavibacter zeaxanthinifaciens]|uniref:terminase small subunit n=1 Tax=Mesoflavibacter zeaxanthinifaciens TaxID=393060 RepID=UPI0003F78FEE|nr:terminase small subunit [Mesoflavibacter zeaxanthinifaciens]